MEFGTKSYINIDNISFENVAKFKYLGMRVTDKNYIQKKFIAYGITECVPPFSLEFSGLNLLPVNNNIKIENCMLFYMSAKLGFRHWESTCTENFQEQGFGESTWT
jgi:hypothetical protein